jgi:hypothetical protein
MTPEDGPLPHGGALLEAVSARSRLAAVAGSSRSPLRGPSGEPAPVSVTVSTGESIALLPLAQEICRRYRQEFPDEQERHGEAGQAWCLHDNLYLLAWAVDDADGSLVMQTEVAWLARVLEARAFPLDRLVRDLDIAADVVRDRLASAFSGRVARVLARAAAYVRSRDTFLE